MRVVSLPGTFRATVVPYFVSSSMISFPCPAVSSSIDAFCHSFQGDTSGWVYHYRESHSILGDNDKSLT